jgi:peptidoglycan/xylan/chitin deacetylase (PgdA/CDA1 family)
MKKRILKTIYNFGGFAPFHWAMREKLLILTYHRFSLDEETGKISAREFENHLSYLKQNNRILPLAETIEHLKRGKTLPPHATVITIDDGYRDAFEIAFPILQKYELPAALYAVTDFIEGKIWLWTDLMRYVLLNTKSERVEISFGETDKIETVLHDKTKRLETANRINSRLKKMPNAEKEKMIEKIARDLAVEIPAAPTAEFAALNVREAREMDAGFVKIESHTMTHPILPNVERAALDFEMRGSKKRLEEILDREIKHFCYPNGSFDEAARQAAIDAGYESATTTDYGFNSLQSDRFLLHRIDAQSAIESFAQSVSGFEAVKQKLERGNFVRAR